MKYILLIYGDQLAEAALSPEQQQTQMMAHVSYAQTMREQGVMIGGEVLMPSSAATTVRLREGKTLTTHGPFAETTEQLGGYYVLEVDHLDEALAWAAKNPSAATGSIEVRPVLEY